MWRHLGLATALLITLVVAALLEGLPSLQPAAAALQRQFAHREDFPGNKALKLLVAQGTLHPYPINQVDPGERDAIRARRRGQSQRGAPAMNLFSTSRTPPHLLPSTKRLPAGERKSGVPVLSVVVAPRDLRGLLSEPELRSRATEITSYVSYFRPGSAVLGFSAGIRLHGGRSRLHSPKKSFRLYLRPIHGTATLPASAFFAEADGAPSTLNRLVIHNDKRTDNFGQEWQLVNPIAYEIARKVGSPTPRTQPVRFFLNGQLQGVYVLTEHLSVDHFETLFGHRDFVMARTKVTTARYPDRVSGLRAGEASDYQEFIQWALGRGSRRPEELATRVNIDNLLRWYISVLLCGTGDSLQGPVVRNNRGPDRRWFWVNWDMDRSFMSVGRQQVDKPWLIETFASVLRRREPRARLLQEATAGPEFRPRFLELFSETLNHRVTGKYLDDLVERYEDLADELGVAELSYFDKLREFLEHRPAVLRQQMSRRFQLPSFTVRVDPAPGRSLQVDGYAQSDSYEGWYLENQVVKLAVRDEDRAAFDHWEIDGRVSPHPEPTLEWQVRADTRVAAVFAH